MNAFYKNYLQLQVRLDHKVRRENEDILDYRARLGHKDLKGRAVNEAKRVTVEQRE